MIAAADFSKHLSADDRLFMLNLNAVEETAAQFGCLPFSDEIEQNVKGEWSMVFGDLPAELPPECSVFHTIPLKAGKPAPNKKMYRMTSAEKEAFER